VANHIKKDGHEQCEYSLTSHQLSFQFFRVAITLRTSTASPPTALYNSEEPRCDVCSDGITRVNECVETFYDGEHESMIGVPIDNEFYSD